MKRITALFLMTLLILAMFPVSAFASNSIYEQAWMQQVLYDNGLVDSIELGPS